MPLQNRVTPWGVLVAIPERGAWMGNRGILHDGERRLGRRRWALKAWLICQLAFKDRQRPVMAPRRYTELFFLDEATALSAGHRPCWECRREAFRRFACCFAAGNDLGGKPPGVAVIDARLHDERLGPGRAKRSCRLPAAGLPDGAFVRWPEAGEQAAIVWRRRLWRWTPAGYVGPGVPLPAAELKVLTPPATVAAIAAGYRPQVHVSLEAAI